MSVINRMLLELDERHDSTAQQRLPGMVRAVPARLPATPVRPRFWIALIFAAALMLGMLILRALVPAKAIAPPVASAPPQAAAIPPSLNLKPANALAQVPIPTETERSHSTETAATPIPAPKMPQISSSSNKTGKTPKKFLLPAREESLDADAKPVEAIVKTKPGADNPKVAIKHVSNEQQAEFRYQEALAFVAQNRHLEAQTALEEALRLEPKHLGARQALFSLFVKAKRYPQAEKILQDGLLLNIAVSPLAATLANVQLEQGDTTAALGTLEKYAAQANGNAEYHGFYAALLQRVGRHAEAIPQFQTALKIQPNRGNWLMGLGISLQAEKRYADAEQAYNRARASRSLSPELQAFIDQRLLQLRQAH